MVVSYILMDQCTDPNLYLNPLLAYNEQVRIANRLAMTSGGPVYLHHEKGLIKVVTLQQHVQVHNGQLITQADVVKW